MQMNKEFTQDIPSFGRILKAYRAQNKLFLSDLSRQWKVSKSTLSKIESGKAVPSTEIVMKILDAVLPDVKGQLYSLEMKSAETIESQGPWMNKFKGRPRE